MIEIIVGTILVVLFYKNMRKRQIERERETQNIINRNKQIFETNDR